MALIGRLQRMSIRRYSVVLSFIAVFVFFAFFGSDKFLTLTTLQNVFSSSSVTIIVASSLTVPLVMGDFDLSVIGGISFFGTLLVVLNVTNNWNAAASLLTVLLAAVIVGLVTGVIVTKFRASAFVITLATSSVLSGFSASLTDSKSIFTGINQSLLNIGQSQVVGIAAPIYIATLVAIVLHFFLVFTVTGRQMAAIGENITAANLVGVKVSRLRVLGFLISCLGGAIAGIVLFTRAGQTYANPGAPFLLPSFAAVFLGASLTRNGRFSVFGAAIAAIFLQAISSALVINQVPRWASDVFAGVVLAVAMIVAPRETRL